MQPIFSAAAPSLVVVISHYLAAVCLSKERPRSSMCAVPLIDVRTSYVRVYGEDFKRDECFSYAEFP